MALRPLKFLVKCGWGSPRPSLQPGVHGFALQGEHAEHALVHPVEGLSGHEPFQRFDAQSKFTNGQRPLVTEPSRAESGQIAFSGVLGPVDDAEVLPAPAP